jgi:hypothetical protein
MTANERFDRTVADWLHEDARQHMPDHLADVLGRTSRTRQRPWWSSHERWLPLDTTFARRMPAMRPAWLLLIVFAALVAIVAISVVGSRTKPLPAPFGPAANGSMLFEDGGDISAAGPDGVPRVLVGGATNDFSPWFAHDGTRFAFLREEGDELPRFMVADANGGNVRPLSAGALYQPDWWDWSPDGRQLIVFHTLDGQRALSILEADGSGRLTTLDLGPVVPEGWADFRPPDGREIVFRGRPSAGAPERTMYAIHPDGTGLRSIAPILSNDNAYNDTSIAPDGSRLLYWNWEADTSPDRMGAHTHSLDLVTGVDQPVTFDWTAESEVTAVFSPDGRNILLERQLPAQLLVVPADLSTRGTRIGPAFDYQDPSRFGFSPDGLQVILSVGDSATQAYRVSDGASLGQWPYPVSTWQRLAP